jgi:hypothetical protein
MKKTINEVNESIVKVCNFCEKIKNLVMWKDFNMTKYIFLLLLIAYFLISMFHIKVLLAAMVFGIAFDGRKIITSRKIWNRKVALNFCEFTIAKNLKLNNSSSFELANF